MKNQDLNPDRVLEVIRRIENMAGQPNFNLEERQDIQVKIRVNENIPAALFKPDPLIPGGYIANSLTIRAMRPDIFVLGDSLEDLVAMYSCACGNEFDIQFWKLCPHCGRDLRP